MNEFLKILSVFISCALFFGKVGMPAAVLLFKFNFIKVFLVSTSAGITGSILFTNISAALLKWWDKFKEKKNFSKSKVFTKTNRFIIKTKKRFGLYGIALLSPILLSIPIGAFVAERFYKDKKRVIIALSISVIFWSITLYLLFLFFYKTIRYI